ncbi:SIR2 family protein [Methylobacterium indicum]|uniref:Novel STAND NTPase 5 domain-containing protein n=1 Tax=Methylobacterium indicum TaxID=1775910 RepID=A0A8H8WP74_9HYPH|nr:SIR2 family protein [Methylobacterium indicum]BCM81822.1 hypothetical protein mvi_02830 [Methylobacterium indicum]
MPASLQDFVRDIKAESTVLLFGAGSSLPSNAPSVQNIMDHMSKTFNQAKQNFSLAEFTELIEKKSGDRKKMIMELRTLFKKSKPTAGLLNLPLYNWKSIYTTNYDTLIEQSYKKKSKTIKVVSSNFDFGASGRFLETQLLKLHGTIEKDVSFGDNSRIIITESDYDHVYEFREHLYNSLKTDLAEANLIIIGSSLSDEDIKSIINKSIQLNSQTFAPGRITLLMYQRDDDRAILYEGRGLRVVFAGIDEFFLELAKVSPGPLFDYKSSENIIERHVGIVPTVVDVTHELETGSPDVSRMFNGWPASYADISNELTFHRTISDAIVEYLLSDGGLCAILVGASGVGKTTAIRQVLLKLKSSDYSCWEHKNDHYLDAVEWGDLSDSLDKTSRRGVLFIDEAHNHLFELNELIDLLANKNKISLIVIATSTRNNWRPRVKTPNLYKKGKEFYLSQLDKEEINQLLALVESKEEISQIIESNFAGFTKTEKRRRLIERCESDMFVCMRNIFASDSFDDIILREYASLPESHQDIYRLVSALETSGVRVHRQLVIRLLGIPMSTTRALLESLTDIINEYTIDGKNHVYGWRGRHSVISAIIIKYKFNKKAELIDLFEKVIDNLSPTYDIEVRSAVSLCNVDTGIPKIADKNTQNRLLRKMISALPGQRVPRHRLIRNLTDAGQFDQAQTEIRIFEKDFKTDAPVARLKIDLLVARAVDTPGIMKSDRLAILEQARELAVTAVKRHYQAKGVFAAYCTVGINIMRLGGSREAFDDAIKNLRLAEQRLGDPDINFIIRRFERQEASLMAANKAEDDLDIIQDID